MQDNSFFDSGYTDLNIDKNSFIIFTNNNNIRHYMSNDSIISASRFTTDIYNQSFSDIIPNGILMTKIPLSAKSLDETYNNMISDVLFPIAILVDFPSVINIPCSLFNKNLELVNTTLDNFIPSEHLFVYMEGVIPYSFTTKVIFRNKSELNNFASTKISNIEFDESLFEIGENYFKGNIEISADLLNDSIKKSTLIQNNDSEDYNLRPKIRAIVQSLLASFNQNIEDSVLVTFDDFTLQLLKEIFQTKRHSTEKELSEITNLTKDFLSQNYIWLNIQKINLSNMFLLTHIDIHVLFYNIINNVDLYIQEPTALKKNIEKYFDVIATQIALKTIVKSSASNFNQKAFLTSFFNELLDYVPEDASIDELSKIDSIKERYGKAHNSIINIIDSYGNLSSQLDKWPKNFQTIKALLFFVTTYDRLKASDLTIKLSKFAKNLNPNDIRLIWMFWSALNGMVYLNYSFKSKRNLLYLSDMLTHAIFSNGLVKNNYFNFHPKYSKKSISVSSSPDSIIVTTGLGFNFEIKMLVSIESIHLKLINLLSNDKNLYLRDIFLDHHLSDEYTSWVIKPNEKNEILIKQIGKGIEIFLNEKPSIEKVWKNWNDFFTKFIINKSAFQRLADGKILERIKDL